MAGTRRRTSQAVAASNSPPKNPLVDLVPHNEVEIFDNDPVQRGVDANETENSFNEGRISLLLNAALFHDSAAFHQRRAARLMLEGKESQAQQHTFIAFARLERANLLAQQLQSTLQNKNTHNGGTAGGLPEENLRNDPLGQDGSRQADSKGEEVFRNAKPATVLATESPAPSSRRTPTASAEDDEGLEFDLHRQAIKTRS